MNLAFTRWVEYYSFSQDQLYSLERNAVQINCELSYIASLQVWDIQHCGLNCLTLHITATLLNE